jgi:hypothetical protein
MKKQILPLLVLILLFGNLQAQFWHNLTDKKGSWGVFKIPGQNTTAPMVLFNRPTISEDTAGEDFFANGDWNDIQYYRAQELVNYCIALELFWIAGYSFRFMVLNLKSNL